LLHPEIGRGKINKLLMAAGRAAALMPELEVMEIWNGGEGHACFFRYSIHAGKPQIIWSSNWGIDVQLDYDVVHCWADLPKHRNLSGRLTTTVNRLPLRRKKVKTLCHRDPSSDNAQARLGSYLGLPSILGAA